MRMTRIGTVYQLSFLPHFFPVNCYLVEEKNALTLIDAALPYSAKGIMQAVQSIGKPLTHIVLTHAHDDHVGALDALKRSLPHVPVSISVRDSHLLRGDRTLLANEPSSPIRGGVPKNIKTQPDQLLQEGDRLGSLEVISTPGHTPGSITLMDTRNRSLIAGDAFQIRGGIAVSGVLKLSFPFPALATWHPATALSSAKKLRELQPALLAVGHGKMLEQPNPAIDRAIAEAEDKMLARA
ncbi:MBL fold metallo-hydrolase [Paenibacillus senegalensis]|uniref:MBL fold metallo-hydrolase n=1 Tax=Paenibacillus senegalensis TaxID=1465766 RepID=UPI0002899EC5|nr:MBL fold metallo-hydrolase [Paenibacillus senegalensis]